MNRPLLDSLKDYVKSQYTTSNFDEALKKSIAVTRGLENLVQNPPMCYIDIFDKEFPSYAYEGCEEALDEFLYGEDKDCLNAMIAHNALLPQKRRTEEQEKALNGAYFEVLRKIFNKYGQETQYLLQVIWFLSHHQNDGLKTEYGVIIPKKGSRMKRVAKLQ